MNLRGENLSQFKIDHKIKKNWGGKEKSLHLFLTIIDNKQRRELGKKKKEEEENIEINLVGEKREGFCGSSLRPRLRD